VGIAEPAAAQRGARAALRYVFGLAVGALVVPGGLGIFEGSLAVILAPTAQAGFPPFRRPWPSAW
jgi:hypothetical protein